ncbi:hypothetical protein B0T17DRAFT_64482 [Bombardia bombarda]|uniref:Arrestin-like N-terminal domain-containing protein n=1 Tax=Bombardia bombarda TaxID=252184 RepID=A0AA39XKZ5_9PEZI|nr:hypothetical protein B0T17DRAFT_64482 [Bombardia bombarda]
MSIRIALDNAPEFFTNLDIIRGQVVLSLGRHETISVISVKLEGESRTALGIPTENTNKGVPMLMPGGHLGRASNVIQENHKVLYKVAQVFPPEGAAPLPAPVVLAPGLHRFNFNFKFPFNNLCSNPAAMARIGGLASSAGGLFGLGGVRVMDGMRQNMYEHVTKTLPPSFTGFPGEAEIRYYVKVTIQRPGLFKENWRYEIGLKFLPIEPPRPIRSNQEAYARRPYAFQPRTPTSKVPTKKRSSFFGGRHSSNTHLPSGGDPNSPMTPIVDGKLGVPGPQPTPTVELPPTIEMSARLPHPPILTCNQPVPLRLIAKNTAATNAEVYLIAFQIDLVGKTHVRCQDLINTELTKWVIVSRMGLSIPVSKPGDPVGTEVVVPNNLWNTTPLPNTVMPSFIACNLSREYQLEIKVGLAWGKPTGPTTSHSSFFPGGGGKGKSKQLDLSTIPQEIHLPLHFSSLEVYSGLSPPPELVEAMQQRQGRRPTTTTTTTAAAQRPAAAAQQQRPPRLPPRVPQQQQQQQQQDSEPPADALYPPQLRPGEGAPAGQEAPPYEDAPPSYDEAMAEEMTGPAVPHAARPAYSGVTNENEPSTIPAGEKGRG